MQVLTTAPPPPHAPQVRALVLHNRWNVFQSAEDYVVWEVAPARLSDGSVVDLWREESSPIAWQVPPLARLPCMQVLTTALPTPLAPQVPRGDEPRRRRGRWRAFPYTAERSVEASAAFWGVLIATDCH